MKAQEAGHPRMIQRPYKRLMEANPTGDKSQDDDELQHKHTTKSCSIAHCFPLQTCQLQDVIVCKCFLIFLNLEKHQKKVFKHRQNDRNNLSD